MQNADVTRSSGQFTRRHQNEINPRQERQELKRIATTLRALQADGTIPQTQGQIDVDLLQLVEKLVTGTDQQSVPASSHRSQLDSRHSSPSCFSVANGTFDSRHFSCIAQEGTENTWQNHSYEKGGVSPSKLGELMDDYLDTQQSAAMVESCETTSNV